MWELWADGEIEPPYAALMTYQSEINNGGHSQYFDNIENTGNLQKEMSDLEKILPQVLKENLQKAYHASEGNNDNKKTEEITEKCDKIFFENEEEINIILEKYSEKIEL